MVDTLQRISWFLRHASHAADYNVGTKDTCLTHLQSGIFVKLTNAWILRLLSVLNPLMIGLVPSYAINTDWTNK